MADCWHKPSHACARFGFPGMISDAESHHELREPPQGVQAVNSRLLTGFAMTIALIDMLLSITVFLSSPN